MYRHPREHLARGQGLVWNVGQPPVEGYTNPLWVIVMAALHWVQLPASKVSLLVQIIAAGLLAVDFGFVREAALALTADPMPSRSAR